MDEVDGRVFAGQATAEEQEERWRILWPAWFSSPDRAPSWSGIAVSVPAYAGLVASTLERLPELEAALPGIGVPFGCLAGADSPIPHDLAGGATARAIPGGWIEVVAGAGHLLWLEQPGCVSAALRRLLAS